MNLHDKLILTDCDGVMLSWEFEFDEWLREQGYKKQREDCYGVDERYGISKEKAGYLIDRFNQSAAIGWLSPHKDAVKYVRKLHEEHGFVFRVITSFEKNMYSVRLRQMNLHNTFGSHVFDSIHCIGDEDKWDYLKQYEGTGCYWLEDKVKNAVKGWKLGLDCFLMTHPYNREIEHPDYPNGTRPGDIKPIENWKSFCEWIA